MLIVTGGAGFIGSNIVRGLNARGREDIVVVDDLRDGRKFFNLVDCRIADYWDKADLIARLHEGDETPEAILHQGACAVTTEWDGRYMMAENYQYSVDLLAFCREHDVPLIYASSAAIYGRAARRSRGLSSPVLTRRLSTAASCPRQRWRWSQCGGRLRRS